MYPNDIKMKIQKDRQCGMSYGEIKKKYKIGRSSIQRIINSSKINKMKTGPKPKLTKSDKRKIKSLISYNIKDKKKSSSANIIRNLALNVSRMTVCRELRWIGYRYSNLPYKFKLTAQQKQKRVDVVRKFIIDKIDWDTVIFCDEKKFSLHGCDSFYTWTNKNQSPSNIRKHLRSPSLMVWGMIMPNGLFSYEIMKGNQNSMKYIDIVSQKAIPIIKVNMGNNFIFQHDNCPIHTSKKTQEYFESETIQVLHWPPYSPDINIIENIWSVLSKAIYDSGPAKNLKHLEYLIKKEVTNFNETKRDYVSNLYKSMCKRLCDILSAKGDRIKY